MEFIGYHMDGIEIFRTEKSIHQQLNNKAVQHCAEQVKHGRTLQSPISLSLKFSKTVSQSELRI
jgi:hypothetical protein